MENMDIIVAATRQHGKLLVHSNKLELLEENYIRELVNCTPIIKIFASEVNYLLSKQDHESLQADGHSGGTME
jgi:hypothetical protein